MNSPKTELLKKKLGISLPIIQAGMVWVSGAKLAAASANCGMLGVIGAGSMPSELLRSQISKARQLSSKALAVNIPLLYDKVEQQIQVALEEKIKIFICSAGSPKKFTSFLQDKGAIAFTNGLRTIKNSKIFLKALSYASTLELPYIGHCQDYFLSEGSSATAGKLATQLGLPSVIIKICLFVFRFLRSISIASSSPATVLVW